MQKDNPKQCRIEIVSTRWTSFRRISLNKREDAELPNPAKSQYSAVVNKKERKKKKIK